VANNIHYEIFRRQGAKGGWALLEVVHDREAALKLAQTLMEQGQASNVKVIKETYNEETGEFLTLKIFEDGDRKVKVQASAEDVPHALPCFKPDDLYSYHARATMARVLAEFLARNRLTVSELIHRADALEKLEATGTTYQHAVQKIAVAQASSTNIGVQQIVKSLDELVTRAIQRVYRDEKQGTFATLARQKLGVVVEKLAKETGGTYLLNGTIAARLSKKSSWNDKLAMLLEFLDEAPTEGAGRALLLSSIDSMIAETLNAASALRDLIQPGTCYGDTLLSLVELFLANEKSLEDVQAALRKLAVHFARNELEASRTALARRIVAEIKSSKRLDPDSLESEVRLLRKIANRIVLGVGKHLSHEDVIAAFTLRAKRLVAPDVLAEILNDSITPDVKLERLLFVAENLIGVENKRRIAEFMAGLLTSAAFENHFLDGATPPLARLHRLATLQASLLRSGVPEAQRDSFREQLDRVACTVESRTRLFESIEAKSKGAVDRTLTLLRLCTSGVLTEGKLSARARQTILSGLQQPGFLAAYASQTTQEGEAEAGIATLMALLAKAGISKEATAKTLAA
jgi:hypothetical protein